MHIVYMLNSYMMYTLYAYNAYIIFHYIYIWQNIHNYFIEVMGI